ncbi:MAG: NADH-quinone oxidoreductase subunit H [Fimbriimonadaceae bacterium]|nr:NADH-quinone oxidoreductase subunit H [Fimbriimonadaceae bacterium]QYK57155.1 MAG: NADH-quinone oxidoreductase subunit H [Fimbriimonadaceae bacterium]
MPGPFYLAILRVLILVGATLTLVPGLIWFERRLLSWMQDRQGPNRTGTITFGTSFLGIPIPKGLQGRKIQTFGLLQPIADGLKLFLKEDITPANIDRKVYFIAPFVALFPAFTLGGTLPWGATHLPFSAVAGGLYSHLTPVADVEIGLLFVLAISSLGVYGVVLAGYASNNKYSLMGGLRASAQLISYELGMGVSLACIAMAVGSLKMSEIVRAQEGPLWGAFPVVQNWFVFTPFGFVSFVVFLVCMIAETNRAPFDLPEAENELIAGYHTEYSSMKFAVFFMGEYAAMFIFSGILSAVFLGGYNLMPFRWEYLAEAVPAARGFFQNMAWANYWLGPLSFVAKCAAGIALYIWIRATLPRLRYDQLMNLGWKTLLPVAVANFIIVGIWVVCTELYGAAGGWAAVLAAFVVVAILYTNVVAAVQKAAPASAGPRRSIRLVKPEGR